MRKIFIVFVLLFLVGCVSNVPKMSGFTEKTYQGNDEFSLSGMEKNVKIGEKLRVYIDGDAKTGGLFAQKAVLEYPVAAELALKDTSPSILYLNRPCYFSDDEKCQPVVWKEGRYNPEIIDEMVFVLQNFVQKYHIPEIELVGYDGGAAVALLVASRLYNKKINVSKVITIAGILDTQHYASLTGEDLHSAALNPAREVYTLAKIPQLHIVGALDKKTPVSLVKVFKKKLGKATSFKVESYESADHYNWAKFKINY